MKGPVEVARLLVRRFRTLRDKTLHRYHRDRASKELQGRPIREVVVLCHGNVCRSPYAEAVLRRELQARGAAHVIIHSAGFVGPDRPSPPDALAVASELGIDMTSHRSKLITGQALKSADLVVVMSPDQAVEARWRGAGARTTVVVLGDLDPQPIDSRTIRDPWNCDEAIFRSSYQRIGRCAEELARIVASNPQ